MLHLERTNSLKKLVRINLHSQMDVKSFVLVHIVFAVAVVAAVAAVVVVAVATSFY